MLPTMMCPTHKSACIWPRWLCLHAINSHAGDDYPFRDPWSAAGLCATCVVVAFRDWATRLNP